MFAYLINVASFTIYTCLQHRIFWDVLLLLPFQPLNPANIQGYLDNLFWFISSQNPSSVTFNEWFNPFSQQSILVLTYKTYLILLPLDILMHWWIIKQTSDHNRLLVFKPGDAFNAPSPRYFMHKILHSKIIPASFNNGRPIF